MPEMLVPLGMMAGAAMGEWLTSRRSGGEFSRQWLQESTDGDSSVSSSQRSSSDDDCSAHSNTRELPSCIRPGLFIGSVAAERDLNILQAMGITHVLQVGVSLRPRHKGALEYHLVTAPDSRVFDIFHAMVACNAFGIIEAARKTGGILVHCAAGRSRSAAVVCAYLMHKEGLECEEAIQDVCETHWICPNAGFKQQLQLFEDLHGDIDRWPSPGDTTWPKKITRRSAMELDRPSMKELRPVRAQPPLITKSSSLPELAAPQVADPVHPAQPAAARLSTAQKEQPQQKQAPEASQKLQRSVEVTPAAGPAAKKPEQATKWLAFQQRVSEQAAEERKVSQKITEGIKPSQIRPHAAAPAACQMSNRHEAPILKEDPPPPANSVFLPPRVWQQSVQARDPNWNLRKALEAAGLDEATPESSLMTRQYSFDDSAPPAPALVGVF